MKNIVESAQGRDFEKLQEDINTIISNTQLFRVKQIDYFNMKDNEPTCTAFILFEEIEE